MALVTLSIHLQMNYLQSHGKTICWTFVFSSVSTSITLLVGAQNPLLSSVAGASTIITTLIPFFNTSYAQMEAQHFLSS